MQYIVRFVYICIYSDLVVYLEIDQVSKEDVYVKISLFQ